MLYSCGLRSIIIITRDFQQKFKYSAYWVPHGKQGWYIGPNMEQYHFHKYTVDRKKSEKICKTVDFIPIMYESHNHYQHML